MEGIRHERLKALLAYLRGHGDRADWNDLLRGVRAIDLRTGLIDALTAEELGETVDEAKHLDLVGLAHKGEHCWFILNSPRADVWSKTNGGRIDELLLERQILSVIREAGRGDVPVQSGQIKQKLQEDERFTFVSEEQIEDCLASLEDRGFIKRETNKPLGHKLPHSKCWITALGKDSLAGRL